MNKINSKYENERKTLNIYSYKEPTEVQSIVSIIQLTKIKKYPSSYNFILQHPSLLHNVILMTIIFSLYSNSLWPHLQYFEASTLQPQYFLTTLCFFTGDKWRYVFTLHKLFHP
jgi:hypothetical protein